MFAELSLGVVVHGSAEGRTHVAAVVTWFRVVVAADFYHGGVFHQGSSWGGSTLKVQKVYSFFLLGLLFFVFGGFVAVATYLFPIDHDFKAVGSNLDILPKNDPFTYSSQHIQFREGSCSEQDIGGLLKASFPQDRDISDPIDAVSVDGSQNASSWHPICQDGQVAVIDIDAVGF